MTTTAKKAADTTPREHTSLAAALAAFQAALPRVGKDNTARVATDKGPGYTYRYADLSEISPVVLPLLAAQGLAWSTRPTLVDGNRFVLVYRLSHTSGQEDVGEYPLPNPGSSPQVLGSAITYARRYALCAVTGVAPGDDDDDAAAAQRQQQRPQGGQQRAQARQGTGTTPPPAEPAQGGDQGQPNPSQRAALDLLRQTCADNKWSQARVAARYAAEHGGADLRQASMRDVETFRKGLFSVPDDELRDTPADPASQPDQAPAGEPAEEAQP